MAMVGRGHHALCGVAGGEAMGLVKQERKGGAAPLRGRQGSRLQRCKLSIAAIAAI